jgi:hypothetical protein
MGLRIERCIREYIEHMAKLQDFEISNGMVAGCGI